MKKILFTTCITLVISFFSTALFAQAEETSTSYPTPKWVSENGYWVVESNVNNPKISTIYFYNINNVMVYKEDVNGIEIKLKRRRVKMGLKKVLEQSVLVFNKKQKAAENEMLVMNLIKK